MFTIEDEELHDAHGCLVLHLVDVEGDEKRREGGTDGEVVLLEMLVEGFVVLLELLVDGVEELHELGHVGLVDASPVLPVHDVEDAPEYLLFVLDVHQKHARDVVHALYVSDFRVVVGVGQQDVVKHLLPGFAFPVEVLALTLEVLQTRRIVREGSTYILSDSVLVVLVSDAGISQLLIHALSMHGLLSVASTQHAPDIPSQIGWNTIQQRLPNPLSLHHLQCIKVDILLVDTHKCVPFMVRNQTDIFITSNYCFLGRHGNVFKAIRCALISLNQFEKLVSHFIMFFLFDFDRFIYLFDDNNAFFRWRGDVFATS